MIITLNNTTIETESFSHSGGSIQVAANGNFDGAKLMMKISQDNLAYITLDDFKINKNDVLSIKMKANTKYILFLDTIGTASQVEVSII